MNGKTADQMREEFYAALDRERSEREARDAAWAAQSAKWAAEREADRKERKEWEAEQRRKSAEVDAQLAEVAARMDQTSKEWRSFAAAMTARMDQTSKEWRSFAAAMTARMDQTSNEWRSFVVEWDKRMAEIRGEWGNFTAAEGRMVENEGVAVLSDLTEIGGMPIEEVKGAFKPAGKGREYDGVIRCPNARVLVEFKRQLRRVDVRKFLKRQLSAFPQDCPELLDGHALYGAVVGALVEDGAQALARENGLFVIRIPLNRRAEILENTGVPRPRE